MKKVCIILCLLTFTIFSACTSYKYPVGKDTRDFFGKDARYQIMSIGKYALEDFEEKKNIESDVYRYYKSKPNVYIVGANGYTILNYETFEIKHSDNLNDFNSEETKIFNSDKKFTKLPKKE